MQFRKRNFQSINIEEFRPSEKAAIFKDYLKKKHFAWGLKKFRPIWSNFPK